MKKHMFLLLVGAVAILGGCTLMPEYVRPQAPVPAAWPTGPTPRDTFMEARDAAHKAQRGRHRKGGRRGCA